MTPIGAEGKFCTALGAIGIILEWRRGSDVLPARWGILFVVSVGLSGS
jgi:hypothetical protein